MKDYHINIFYSDEDEGYIADIPDLAMCSAFGTSPAEALAMLEQAKHAWLEAAKAEGKPPYQTALQACDLSTGVVRGAKNKKLDEG